MPAPTLLYPTHPSVRELKISTLAICCAVRSTYVGELNDAEATEVGEAIVGGILVDNEGDVLCISFNSFGEVLGDFMVKCDLDWRVVEEVK